MLEPGGQQDLAPEPLGADAGGHFWWQHLHHHPAPQASLFGHEHARHATAA
jgi:hypothetical protein